jgi:hypothetical protein
MPRGDRTGPAGMGPMSGRAAGYCARFDMPGFANRAWEGNLGAEPGSSREKGSSGGHGWRHRFWATGLPGWMRRNSYHGFRQEMLPSSEKQLLKYQADILKSQLDMVKQRLNELDSPDSKA